MSQERAGSRRIKNYLGRKRVSDPIGAREESAIETPTVCFLKVLSESGGEGVSVPAKGLPKV
jgi:hypothetical protein